MTIRHMKIFVAVCESNSVTEAAKKLYLAQPAVSLAISQLENYYGVKLFDRISRRLYITETGKRLLNYATHIVSLYDELENSIKDWDTIGILRVGSSITIGNYILPNLVKEFNKKYPNIKVNVLIDNSKNIESNILSNKLDFAFIEGLEHNSQITYEKFMTDRLAIICGTTHPLYNINHEIDLNSLTQYDFILREKGSGGRELFDSIILINNLEIKPLWESIDTQAIINAVKSGIGLSALPYLLVKKELENGEIKEINVKNIVLNRTFYAIYHKNKYLTKTAKSFINMVKSIKA